MRVGSVGLGGNGQFTRLSALRDLGWAPWTPCLTEDLDLGLRLLVVGWENKYCHTTYVAQQAVVSPGRLLRQRARWFQGNLQCLQRVPLLLRSSLGIRTTLDVLHHLLAPFAILLTSLLPVLLGLLGLLFLVDPNRAQRAVGDTDVLALLGFYALTFAFVPVLAHVYRSRTPVSGPAAVLLAHLYVLYAWLWYVAGWWAVVRVLRGRNGWAKTARTRSADTLTAEQAAGRAGA
ncbi:glycosyltransferase [Kineococcus sp. T90]|nr:glycosyltransferase [Kineococcus indalonis]